MIIRLTEKDNKREWVWTGAPSLDEARLIKARTGWTIKGFLEAFEEMDPDAYTSLLYVLYRRDGEVIPWDDITCDVFADSGRGLPLLEFELSAEEEKQAAVAIAAAGMGKPVEVPPPTNGNGRTEKAALKPKPATTRGTSRSVTTSTT